MVFTLCAFWSMTIFYRFKMSKTLSEEENVLIDLIELLDEDNFFTFFCLCVFRSLATSSIMFVLTFPVFSQTRCGLSSDVWGDGDEGSRKKNGESHVYFPLSLTSDWFFRFLQISCTARPTNWEKVSARLASVSINADNCVQWCILRLKTLSTALFCVAFLKTSSKKLNNAIFKLSFAESKSIQNAPDNTFSVAYVINSCTLLKQMRSASFCAICFIITRSLAWLRSLKRDFGGCNVESCPYISRDDRPSSSNSTA